MKASELKEKLFGDFLKWLEKNNIGDHFNMDVWMTKCWEKLFGMYLEDVKNGDIVTKALKTLPVNIIKEFVEEREKQSNSTESKSSKIVGIDSAKKQDGIN